VRFRSLAYLIGNTPLLAVRCRFRDRETTVYCKFEVRNFTGSIKDRMALRILEDAYESGEVCPGDEIVEATSGNTGISFAAVGRALGHGVRIYMPDWMSPERVQVIRSLGATITPITHAEGGFRGCIAATQSYAREHEHVFLPRQFESRANVQAHHRTTGPEIVVQLRSVGLEPTGFVAGVGTGGTVAGVGEFLREEVDPGIAVHPVEPANSPTLRTGPPIVHLDELDPVLDVWDGDAIIAAQMLASQISLGVGISSGANLLAALQLAHRQGPDAVVATVFPDSNKKYLSTDLCKHEEMKDHYLSRDLRLVGCRVIPPAL
jgi:cysteine synthase A